MSNNTSITSNLKFKPEISAAALDLEKNDPGSATPGNILCQMKEIVSRELNKCKNETGFNTLTFKSDWTTRINIVLNDLGLSGNNKRITKKHWDHVFGAESDKQVIINEATPGSSSNSERTTTTESSKRSSTSSLSYQNKIYEEDRYLLQTIHGKIEKKWILKPSGICVEDVLHEKSIKFDYDHPMHSYILNINDSAWKEYFEEADQDEIIESSENCFKDPLPEEVMDLLRKLNKKKSFEDIYKTFKNVDVDRYDDAELYWVKESILNYIHLFRKNNKIIMRTEQDLLEEVFGFIRRSREVSNTETETASGSMASSEAKNGNRALGTTESLTRQATGDHADLVFMINSEKVACVEIGLKNNTGAKGTKGSQEKGLKTPRMMKAFCGKILREFSEAKAENITIIGYVISGMYISALQMSFKKGSTALLSVSDRLKMPESIREVPALLPPVLALVYNCTQVTKKTVEYIDNISLSFSLDTTNESAFFPPVFIPQPKSNNKKRKTSQL